MMSITVNISRQLERPALNIFRHCSTSVKKGLGNANKDDHNHIRQPFALKLKAETIHHVLGWKISKAKQLLKNNRILSQKPLSHYTTISEIVEPFIPISGLKEEGTHLLLASAPTLQRNCQFLQECGATKATADIIGRCQNFTGVSIGVFKSYAHVDSTVDIQAKWLDMLSDPLLCDKTKLFLEEITFSSSIAHVRNVIFASYVAHKWNVPFPKVLTWVEDGIKTLPFAIGRLMRILDVLSDIGFSQEKIWKHPTLLQSDPNSLELFMHSYEEDFLGENASKFLQEFPAVTCQIDIVSLLANVHSLRVFGVPENCIRNNLFNLLVHDPIDLQEKLRKMEPYPELGVFVHHPKFGKLLNDVDTVILRVETFRAIDKRQITFTACTSSAKDFSAIIHQRAQQRLSEEAVCYLADHTGYEKNKVREILRSHPQSSQLTSENMKKVIELLNSRCFTKLQIFNGLQLTLYPVEIVEDKLNELPHRLDMQPIETTLKEPSILEIVLYLLEQQFMFTGNGVFAKSTQKSENNA